MPAHHLDERARLGRPAGRRCSLEHGGQLAEVVRTKDAGSHDGQHPRVGCVLAQGETIVGPVLMGPTLIAPAEVPPAGLPAEVVPTTADGTPGAWKRR